MNRNLKHLPSPCSLDSKLVQPVEILPFPAFSEGGLVEQTVGKMVINHNNANTQNGTGFIYL